MEHNTEPEVQQTGMIPVEKWSEFAIPVNPEPIIEGKDLIVHNGDISWSEEMRRVALKSLATSQKSRKHDIKYACIYSVALIWSIINFGYLIWTQNFTFAPMILATIAVALTLRFLTWSLKDLRDSNANIAECTKYLYLPEPATTSWWRWFCKPRER